MEEEVEVPPGCGRRTGLHVRVSLGAGDRVCLSVCRSVGRSIDRLICRSLRGSVGRSIGQSVSRSVGRSVGRWIVEAVGHRTTSS